MGIVVMLVMVGRDKVKEKVIKLDLIVTHMPIARQRLCKNIPGDRLRIQLYRQSYRKYEVVSSLL
jgi:hypothetical protein